MVREGGRARGFAHDETTKLKISRYRALATARKRLDALDTLGAAVNQGPAEYLATTFTGNSVQHEPARHIAVLAAVDGERIEGTVYVQQQRGRCQ